MNIMKKPITQTKNKKVHTSNSQMGMGDMMGSGKVNPSMKIKEGFGKPVNPKKLKVPPKSLA